METTKLFILCLALAGISYAALPDTITNPNERDAMEYLDGKVSAIMGFDYVENACGAVDCTASCATNRLVIGGGCEIGSNDYVLINHYTANHNGWQCKSTTANITAYAVCSRVR